MVQADSYTKLDSEDIKPLLELINPLMEGTQFPADDTTILERELSFYPNYVLLDISNHSITPVPHRYVLKSKDKVIPLNFSNKPIYELNTDGALDLNKGNVTSYVQFFFEYVRGKKGHFQVIESLDDIEWLEEPTSQARRSLAPKIEEMDLEQIKDNGTYVVNTTMIFKDCLIRSKIDVDPQGFVTMKNQTILESGLFIRESHIAS